MITFSIDARVSGSTLCIKLVSVLTQQSPLYFTKLTLALSVGSAIRKCSQRYTADRSIYLSIHLYIQTSYISDSVDFIHVFEMQLSLKLELIEGVCPLSVPTQLFCDMRAPEIHPCFPAGMLNLHLTQKSQHATGMRQGSSRLQPFPRKHSLRFM